MRKKRGIPFIEKARRVFRGVFPRRVLRPAAGAVLVLAALYLILRFSPYPALASFMDRPLSARFFDRGGELIQIGALEGGVRREYKPLSAIPPEVRAVFVHAEDRRFFRHFGVDPVAIVRAFWQNITSGRRVSGASTITMQLARLVDNRTVGADRGHLQKILEAFNALRLEARLSKDEILEFYLNSIPFGFRTEGIVSASRSFFSSEVFMLTPAQIFCLAVIPRRPGAYNPLSESAACAAAASRLQERFSRDRSLAKAYPLLASIKPDDWTYALNRAESFPYPYEMPHFVRYVSGILKEAPDKPLTLRNPRAGEITLSADLGLQRYLEGLLSANVSRYYGSRITNGAAVVMDNDSGEILAWVGSADYHNDEAAGQIDGVLALNQTGSCMKPFLYAEALENGFNPSDVLADIPMDFGTEELYVPQNFNNRFNGPMLLRSALASSLNIPAVYLLYRLGFRNYIDFLLSLGFDSLVDAEKSAGLGLALGNAPVSLAELVRAFSVFPGDGELIPLVWEKAEPLNNSESRAPGERIISRDTARVISSILSDRSARVLAFGMAANFETPFPAIFKTGTANQYQSIAALGATPRFSAAVWMGNFTGETVIGKTGSSIPLAIARDALVFLQGKSGGEFPEPEGFVKQPVCSLSGMRAGPACPSVILEYVRKDTEKEICDWHITEDGNTKVIYPGEYQAWFYASEREGELDYGGLPLEITSPRDNFVFFSSPGAGKNGIPVEVKGGGGDELTVQYDGETFTVSRPFMFYLPLVPGKHELRVYCGGESAAVNFTVNN